MSSLFHDAAPLAQSSDGDAESVFAVRGLTKVYHMGEVDVHALRGVDLDLFAGEFVVLLGPSGSGKSHAAEHPGRPRRAHQRHGASIADDDLTEFDDAALTRYRREHVGFVFQFYNLIPSLTARENVALVTEIADDPMTPERGAGAGGPGRAAWIIFRRSCPAASSSGWRSPGPSPSGPTVLLCDEPTGALDVAHRHPGAGGDRADQPRAGHDDGGDHPQRRHRRHGRPRDLDFGRQDRPRATESRRSGRRAS